MLFVVDGRARGGQSFAVGVFGTGTRARRWYLLAGPHPARHFGRAFSTEATVGLALLA